MSYTTTVLSLRQQRTLLLYPLENKIITVLILINEKNLGISKTTADFKVQTRQQNITMFFSSVW